MKALLSTPEFQSRVSGKPLDPYKFSTDFGSPGIFSIHLGTAQSGVKGHLISSLPLDWALMQELAPASSAAGANFDSLMVPFRCVGSDVLAKNRHLSSVKGICPN
jgi:NTE family protein